MPARWLLVAGLLFGAGCSQLLGFEDLHAQDAAISDASVDASVDAHADAAPCVSMPLTAVNAIEDTFILNDGVSNPSIRYGKTDTINVGQSGTSRVLLRFDLSSELAGALPETSTVSATLSVTIRATGGVCGGACPNAATTFQVYAATDGWNEGNANAYNGASWVNKVGTSNTVQTAWQVAGADGSSDRSMVALGIKVVTAQEAAAAGPFSLQFPLTAQARSEVMARLAGTRLSLVLVPTSGGTLFLHARESASPGVAAKLSFSRCE